MKSPVERLHILQKRIYESLKKQAHALLGDVPETIRKYEKRYKADFDSSKSVEPIDKTELIRAIRKSDVTFVADFHSFHQSQRTAIRLMRDSIKPGEHWFIGLEMIPSHFQKHLDAFQSGKISLERFHLEIRYQDEWGFPWENYAPLFEWAKENKIRLVALNQPGALRRIWEIRDENAELHKRDQWAAGVITDLFSKELLNGHKPKMLVLYGELHLGTRHIPYQLEMISRLFMKKPLQWTVVNQNNDKIYWELAKKKIEHRTEFVKLKKDVYCAISSTPWAKLQSLVNWIEGHAADPEMDSEVDYLSLLNDYGKLISDFMDIAPLATESLTVRTIADADFLGLLNSDGKLTKEDRRLVRNYVVNNLPLFIPAHDIVYLGSPSMNRIAELAAIALARKNNPKERLFDGSANDFFRLVLEQTFGFFGSLVVNPKRKAHELEKHEMRMQMLKKGQREHFPYELEALSLTTFVLKNTASSILKNPKFTRFLNDRTLWFPMFVSTRLIGQSLGKALHTAVIDGKISLDFAKKIWFETSLRKTEVKIFEAVTNQLVSRNKLNKFSLNELSW